MNKYQLILCIYNKYSDDNRYRIYKSKRELRRKFSNDQKELIDVNI